MVVSDKDKVKIEFIVSRNRRIALPCIAFVSNSSLSKGLMFVDKMSRSVGALFIFEKSGYHSAWMKNTRIPLDIIWVSEEGIVCEIVSGKPHDETSIGGNVSSRYMIEVVRGYVEAHSIRKGMRIKVRKIEEE